MTLRTCVFGGLACAALVLGGCGDGDPMDTEGVETEGETGESEGTSEGGDAQEPPAYSCGELMLACVDESACAPASTDYMPRENNSADDTWPACISDGGVYELVDSPPSSIARIEAFENIADKLWRNGVPTAQDFLDARVEYTIEEGLESRVNRREDLHYDPIPEAEWDDAFDSDKQCSVPALAAKYDDRCAGPSQIAPLVNAAFEAGSNGEGDPTVHAAEIEAGLLWFLYISTYKEAYTCAANKAKDCDSAWAYYTGGFQIDGGIGLASYVKMYSENAHNRIFDGVLASRCWRNLVGDGEGYPLIDELPPSDVEQFNLGWEQLDNALHRGYAVVVRERLIDHIGGLRNGDSTVATWAFLQVAGPVLDREASERGAPEAGTLAALWQSDGTDEAALTEGLAALDSVFDCP